MKEKDCQASRAREVYHKSASIIKQHFSKTQSLFAIIEACYVKIDYSALKLTESYFFSEWTQVNFGKVLFSYVQII